MVSGMPVTPSLILFLSLSWDAVQHDCRGGMEYQPVRYQVAYRLGFMRDSPLCPRTEAGDVQPCIGWTTGLPVTESLSLSLPEPAVGEVTVWDDPVSLDPAGNRSEACQ